MINWVNITLLVFVLMLWATVAWGVATFLIGQPPEDTIDESADDDDGGIPPLDDPDLPKIDWGAWSDMETDELTLR